MGSPQSVTAQNVALNIHGDVFNTGGVNFYGIYNAPSPPAPPADRAQAESWLFGGPAALPEQRFSSWLDPRAGVIELRQRPECRELAAWCTSQPAVLVRLVRGPGGQGKTLLAEQLCRQMRADGWLAGLVALPPVNWRAQEAQAVTRSMPHLQAWAQTVAAAAHATTLAEVKGVLLVVDYADGFAEVATALLDSIVAARHRRVPVRLLLLARHTGRWWTDIVLRYSGGLVEPQAITLPALQESLVHDGHETTQLTRQLWDDAAEAFTAKAITEGLLPPEHEPDRPSPLGPFHTTLELYADALNHVLDKATQTTVNSAARTADPVTHLLHTHEYRQLALTLAAAAPGAYLGPQPMRVLDVLCLRTAGGQAEAAQALSVLPDLAALPAPVMRELVAALAAMYPGATGKDVWSAPQPDRLADLHLLGSAADALSDHDWSAHLLAIAATDSENEAAQTVETMLRVLSAREATTSHQEGARRLRLAVEALVTAAPRAYLTSLVAADHSEQFTAAMSQAIDDPATGVDVVRSVDIVLSQMPIPRYRLLGVHVSQKLVAAQLEADPAAMRLHCHDLITFSRRLAEAGRDDEAMSAASEAYAALSSVPIDGDDNLALHAAAHNNLGSRLLQANRAAEALTAITEAVRLRAELSEKDPAALPELAAALTNQVACYLELGSAGAAVDAAHHAIDALPNRQDMAPRDKYRLSLAWGNLAEALRAAGRISEAIAAAERALTHITELSDDHPFVYQAGLAAAQLRLAACLALPSTGNRQAIRPAKRAVQLAQQAVGQFRSLFTSYGEPYRADLAQACHTLAICQAQTSPSDGLSAVDEALTLLTAGETGTPNPQLAACLSTKALVQLRVRQTGAARTTAHASVTHYTEAQEQGLAVDRDLAAAQSNLAYVLYTAGDRPEAIAAADRAVHLRRGQETTSATLTLELADALSNLALCCAGDGMLAAAREAQNEAVDLYLAAAADHPIALARLRLAQADLRRLRGATPRTPRRFAIRARFRRHWPLAPVRHMLPGVSIGFWATDLAPRRHGPRQLREELLAWLDRTSTQTQTGSTAPAAASASVAPVTTSVGALPLRLALTNGPLRHLNAQITVLQQTPGLNQAVRAVAAVAAAVVAFFTLASSSPDLVPDKIAATPSVNSTAPGPAESTQAFAVAPAPTGTASTGTISSPGPTRSDITVTPSPPETGTPVKPTWAFTYNAYPERPGERFLDVSENPETNKTFSAWRVGNPTPAPLVRFTRLATGRHRVVLPKVGAPGGIVHVTAFDVYRNSAPSCQAVRWEQQGEDETVEVACFNRLGQPADVRFLVLFLAGAGGTLSLGDVRGWAYASRPEAGSYTPPVRYRDRVDLITRRGSGRYEVTLAPGAASVQLTPIGEQPRFCWLDGLSGSSASVVCTTREGTPVDTAFTVSYTGGQSLLDDRRRRHAMFVNVEDSAGAPGITSQWLSNSGTAKVTRLSERTGFYELRVPLGLGSSHTHVTTHGDGRCVLEVSNDDGKNNVVHYVGCYTLAGVPAYHSFSLTYMTATISDL